jgi:hypothetical protein
MSSNAENPAEKIEGIKAGIRCRSPLVCTSKINSL